jgi:hypothetical protein
METSVSMNSNDIRKQLAQQVFAIFQAQVEENTQKIKEKTIFSEFKDIKVEEALQLDGLEFVAACYYLILKRPPDLIGFGHLSKRYLDCPSKEVFLLELIQSGEGQAKKEQNHSARTFIETRIFLKSQEEQKRNASRVKKNISLFLNLLKFPFQLDFSLRKIFTRLDSNTLKSEVHFLKLEAAVQKLEIQNRMILAELIRMNELLKDKKDGF